MRKSAGSILLFAHCAFALALAGPSAAANPPQESEIYAGWLKTYNLKFDEAHRVFAAWKQSHSDDSLGPASNAAAYLFSALARLGALESEREWELHRRFPDDELYKREMDRVDKGAR